MPGDELSEALTAAVREARTTFEDLALGAGLGKDTVGRWVRGATVPTLSSLRRVEQRLTSVLGREIDLGAELQARRQRAAPQFPAAACEHFPGSQLAIAPPFYRRGPVIRGDSRLTRAAFHPNGRLLAGADGRIVRLWDLADMEPVGAPLVHTQPVIAMAFHPNGSALATFCRDGTEKVRLWNVDDREEISTLHAGADDFSLGEDVIFDLAFDRNGDLLATANRFSWVTVWSPATGRKLHTIAAHAGAVTDVTFHPDGKLLASSSDDKTVRLWNPHTGEPVGAPLTGHGGPVNAVAFHPDGQLLATGSDDSTALLWDLATRRTVGQPLAGHTSFVSDVAFRPDGNLLATSSDDKTVRLWNPHTGEPVGAPLTGHTEWISGVAFHPNGDVLATGSLDGTIRLWTISPDPRT